MEKAYKLLALQEKISNNEAKRLIDDGFVFVGNNKVKIARAEMSETTKFRIVGFGTLETLFEDERIIAVNKPYGMESEAVSKRLDTQLLHRLDKTTSGVLLLVKDEAFRQEAIQAFRENKVYKEYIAIVNGIVPEPTTIDAPIKTVKGNRAKSSVSPQGEAALTRIEPMAVAAKKTKLKVVIETGKTHQIRVHLAHIGHPIVGDEQYGGQNAPRLMLHAYKISLLGYDFSADEPPIFKQLLS